MSNLSCSPRGEALRAVTDYVVQPTSVVTYTSTGALLLIGTGDCIEPAIKYLPESLKPYLLLTTTLSDKLSQEFVKSGIPFIETEKKISVAGYLGSFQVFVAGDDSEVSVNRLFPLLIAGFDLVLDLQSIPSIKQEVLPLGYFAPGILAERYKQALGDCAELVGEFDKPRFFKHDPSICAHDRSGVAGCQLCMDSCSAVAITSENQQLNIDPFLCQGCGDCSTICPAGAINYQYPNRADTLNRIRLLIRTYLANSGASPVLLFHSESNAQWLHRHIDNLAENILPYTLESLGSVGIEIWLAALAYGAVGVKLLACEQLTDSTKRLLDSQLKYNGEILSEMGFDPACVGWIDKNQLCSDSNDFLNLQHSSPANFAGIEDKRVLIRLAIACLSQHVPLKSDFARLSEGAPFGELLINTTACTLCMACVSICPEGALNDGHDQPQLKFIEANCVQCGLCERACPEQAIRLSPRILFDGRKAQSPRVLHEETAFHCIQCGKAFATESMIKTITDKLKNHPMFQGEHSRRLKMCEDCRVNSMFSA